MKPHPSRHLVFLHGALGSPNEHSWWQSRLPDWQVTVPELAIADSWYEEIDRLIDQLPYPAVLIGYSLGARLALGLAIRQSWRWHGLVILSGSPGLRDEGERELRRQSDGDWCHQLQQRPLEDFLADWYRQPVFAGDPLDTIAALILEKRLLDRRYTARVIQVLSVANQPDYRQDLAKINMPVLVVAGDQDEKYIGLAQEMTSRLPAAQLHRIPGAGHVVYRSHPEETLHVLREFLAQIGHGHSTKDGPVSLSASRSTSQSAERSR